MFTFVIKIVKLCTFMSTFNDGFVKNKNKNGDNEVYKILLISFFFLQNLFCKLEYLFLFASSLLQAMW